MAVHDDLGTRMKEYESRNQYFLQKRTPVIIRVDGRSFHTFTKGFQKPFDDILIKSMQETMKYMCENIQGCVFGYCQSDEITLVLIDYATLNTDCWFNYRTDKLCSISASMATMAFNKFFSKNVKEWIKNPQCGALDIAIYEKAIDKGAMFDARCFNIPKEEVTNLVYWRQLDAARNSVQMVGQANFSHKELQNKTCNMIQDILHEQKGINWNDYPTVCKRGTACIKVEIESERINATGWVLDTEMPILKGEGREYLEKLINVGE